MEERKLIKQFFQERKIDLAEISAQTGYSENYIRNLFGNSDPINNKVRFTLIRAFPEIQTLFLPVANGEPSETNGKPTNGHTTPTQEIV